MHRTQVCRIRIIMMMMIIIIIIMIIIIRLFAVISSITKSYTRKNIDIEQNIINKK